MVKVYTVGYYYYCNNNDGDDCGHLLGVPTMLVGLVLVVVLLTGCDDGSMLTNSLLFLPFIWVTDKGKFQQFLLVTKSVNIKSLFSLCKISGSLWNIASVTYITSLYLIWQYYMRADSSMESIRCVYEHFLFS